MIKNVQPEDINEIHYYEMCHAGDQLCVLIIMGFVVFASLLNFSVCCDFLFRIRLHINFHT